MIKHVVARTIRVLLTAALICGSVGFVPAARADVRDFPFTYEWTQNTKGERELAYHLGYFQSDNSVVHEFEFEYGVSNRFSIAPSSFSHLSLHPALYEQINCSPQLQRVLENPPLKNAT